MAADEKVLQACELCGATIYPEHLQRHTAELWAGRLLCPHCLAEKKAEENAALDVTQEAAADPSQRSASIHSFGEEIGTREHADPAGADFRRPLLQDTQNATRCRTFHCRMSDAAFAHLNQQINEWVDAHDDVQIKQVVSNIGVIEGKHTDQNLLVTVFF